MGKSTLLHAIATKYPEYQVCREGDYSPVELAWCTWMTPEEYEAVLSRYEAIRDEIEKHTVIEKYTVIENKDKELCLANEHGKKMKSLVQNRERYIVCYTKILTDIPGFHKDLEAFEIYNGRKSFEEMQEIIFNRYQKFFERFNKYSDEAFYENGYLFECSFLQNIIEDLILFHQLNDDEIVDFYRRLYAVIDKENFLLLYLYAENIEETTSAIQKERSDGQGNEMWYPLMLEYLVNSPYGKEHGYKDFDDMVEHFKHRQRLEFRVLKEVVGENAVVIPAKAWDERTLNTIHMKMHRSER